MNEPHPGKALILRIDWSELDLFGHVNNVQFFKYIQASRIACWEELGISALYETEKIGPLLASCSCNFLRPLHYPGTIRVVCEVVFMKNSSFGLRHRIFNEAGELCAEGDDVIVLWNYGTGIKAQIPNAVRNAAEKRERHDPVAGDSL